MKKLIALLVTVGLIVACSSSDDSNPPLPGGGTDTFNRAALLIHTADNMIIPALEDLDAKIETLKTATETFTAAPNQANMDAASTAWLDAYKVWQHVEIFNIGPAKDINQYRYFMNIYPVNVTDVQNAATTGTYNLASTSYQDAQGFPAIDYLLHAENALTWYTGANAEGYKNFLNAVVTRMDDLTTQVLNGWNTTYRNAFVANTESSATGGVDIFATAYVEYYEKGFRTNKFGTPTGIFSNGPRPQDVEAYYKGDVSKTLALEAFITVKNVFNGVGYDGTTTGASLKSYLEAVNRADVATTINNKYDNAGAEIETINNNFSQQIQSDINKMTFTYDLIQSAVANLKTDMPSALNLTVEFSDNDND